MCCIARVSPALRKACVHRKLGEEKNEKLDQGSSVRMRICFNMAKRLKTAWPSLRNLI
jgi:hypothetical protein